MGEHFPPVNQNRTELDLSRDNFDIAKDLKAEPATLSFLEWREKAYVILRQVLDNLERVLASNTDLLKEFHRLTFVICDAAPTEEPDLLGSYFGVTSGGDGSMQLPPLIELYLDNLLDVAAGESHEDVDAAVFSNEISVTIHHELAHHFGMSHERMEQLGIL